MIQLDNGYTVFFSVLSAGVGVAADSTPAAVLWRNGSATIVSVTVSTTATTGLYKATFTTLGTGDGWATSDHLTLSVTATIDGTADYLGVIWDSNGDVDAVMRGTDGANTTAPATPTNVTDAQAAILAVTATQETLNSLITSAKYTQMERAVDDGVPITFAWPVDDATITATMSIDNEDPFVSVNGAISFLRTDGGKHWYTLAYNASDRPTENGTVRYAFTDGTYTKYLNVSVTDSASQDSVDALSTLLTTVASYVDTEVAAIKAKTDNLPADPATETTLAALDTLIDAIKAVTDTLSLSAIRTEMDDNSTKLSGLTTELTKVPKSGETHRYTQIAADAGDKSADVTIGDV